MSTDAAFETLGIATGSSTIEIKRAFRALTRDSHPDRGGDASRFAQIVSAYRELQRAGYVQVETTDWLVGGESFRARSHSRVENHYRHFARAINHVEASGIRASTHVTQFDRSRVVEPNQTNQLAFAEILERQLHLVD